LFAESRIGSESPIGRLARHFATPKKKSISVNATLLVVQILRLVPAEREVAGEAAGRRFF
jgi:hypothetical protein